GRGINNPRRSFCYSCGTTLTAWDNLPQISYLQLQGRCRY
ncbi:MAG: prepilin peptidase, partial [Armatimonadetes bacterium]|nr:prepilin peptidase [Armatimonadota bacterium]